MSFPVPDSTDPCPVAAALSFTHQRVTEVKLIRLLKKKNPEALSRRLFFIILFTVLVCPFLIHKVVWLMKSNSTTGTMEFVGHGNLGSVLGISTYPVIMFVVGSDTFHFNGSGNSQMTRGQKLEIRYQKHDPNDAKINSLISLWGDTLVYSLGPLLVFLGLFLTPDVIPLKSKMKIGYWPLVQVL